MFVQFMCILAKMNVMMSLYAEIYMCMPLYKYVIGRSWVRVPPGVRYFPESFDGFKKTFSSWKYVLFPVRG